MEKAKIIGTLGFVFLMLALSSVSVNAVADDLVQYYGYAYLGGTAAPFGTIVTAYTGTGELVGNTTVIDLTLGNYTLNINVSNESSTSDGFAYGGDNLTFKLGGATSYTPAPESETVTAYASPPVPEAHANTDINTTPSCTDGVKNQGELLADCGGTSNCTPCYALNVTPITETETFTGVNTSQNFTLYIYNTGYHNISGINFVLPASCNFTVNLTNESIHDLVIAINGAGNGNNTGGSWTNTTISINKTLGDLPYGTYNCNITVNSTNATAVAYLILTFANPSTTTTMPRRRYFDLAYSPDAPTTCDCVTLTVTDRSTGNEVSDADVDVFVDAVKKFYGITDDDGKFEFCPTDAETYQVKLDRSRYRQYIEDISVSDCGVTTTIVAPVVTTTVVDDGDDEAEVTTPVVTDEPVVTTPVVTDEPVVTTEEPVATTVPPQPEDSKDGMSMTTWLMILIVIIIVLVVLYLVTKKKKEETDKKK